MTPPEDKKLEEVYRCVLDICNELLPEDARAAREQFAVSCPEATDLIEMMDGNLALRELRGTE